MICVMKSSLKIVWKTKITFLLSEALLFFLKQKCVLFLETYFCNSYEFNYLSIFFAEADTKNNDMPRQKPQIIALVKLTDWIIKNDHVINCEMFFCKWLKHGQTSNVIWLSTTWLLIFRLEGLQIKSLYSPQSLLVYEFKFAVKNI